VCFGYLCAVNFLPFYNVD